MPISDWIEKLGRTVFESPFGSLDSDAGVPELAEIRLAILDEVKARSHRVARSLVFPCNVVKVRLCGVPEDKAGIFLGDFFPQYCRDELRQGLARSNYRFPQDLEVEVETTPEFPAPGGSWILVSTETRKPAVDAPPENVTAQLVVVKGSTNSQEFVLTRARTNIGRSVEVYRTEGPSRKNDLAFDESGEVNRSVSREHAHIMLDRKTGRCRLFNDRMDAKNAGVWIVRDGLSQAIHRDARGFLLNDGDEIHLGRAVLRFISSGPA